MDYFLPLQTADNMVAAVLPPLPRVIIWAGLAGAVSMGIYAITSPQKTLRGMAIRSREMRGRLSSHDGDFNELLALTKENLRLAGTRLLLTIPATVVSLVPVLYFLVWMETAFESEVYFSTGPAWARGWIIPAILSLVSVSLVIRNIFRIE